MDNQEMEEFLKDVVGICEATHFEKQCLWQTYHKCLAWSWQENSLGYLKTVGMIDEHPTVMSLFTATVDGEKILFWHATSQVVDYRLIDSWFERMLPDIKKADANNFNTLF